MDVNTFETDLKAIREDASKAMSELKTAVMQEIAEVKKNGVADPETKEKIDRLFKRVDSLDAQMLRAGKEPEVPEEAKTIGQMFIESDNFLAFHKRGWHKGGAQMKWDSPLSPFTHLSNPLEQKTLITTTAVGRSTPGILVPQRMPGIVDSPMRALRVRNLLNVQPVVGDAVEWVKENAWTSAASPQTEGSAKAESALTFTIAHDHVHTIAHWIPATRQVLDDFVQLRAFIDMRLMYGLLQKEEDEILAGDGLGDHLNGLITQATAYDTTLNVANDNKADKLRHAKYQARLAEYPVDGVIMHPKDVHDLELIKNDEGGTANKGFYVLREPGSSVEVAMVWGMPIVETTAITSGKFLVGAFGLGATLFDRMQPTIDVSTEHSTYFTENKVAIRCEERILLAVTRPAAFIYGTF